MGVVILVTGETILLQCYFEDRFDVTGFAFSLFMRADQCIFRDLFMIEANVGPAAAVVAGFASFAEVAFVVVVLQVAGDTCHIKFIGERVLAVAAIAVLFGMLAVQHEIRIAIVIEARVVPAFRAVTVAAIVAATALVCIVLGMAVVALGRRVLEGIVLMAVQASGLQVFANQRITGRIMIEFDVLPLHRRMTIATHFAKRSAMRIVFFVTRVAIAGRVAVLFVFGVARGAIVFGVFAEQRKVREIVIEGILVEVYDVGIATLVIGMALHTGHVPGSPDPSVEACRFFDVCSDVLVAVKAQRALFASLEFLMAQGALAFILRMTLDHFPRHDQGFDLGMSRVVSEYRQSHNYSSEKKSKSHAVDITVSSTCEPREHARAPTTPS